MRTLPLLLPLLHAVAARGLRKICATAMLTVAKERHAPAHLHRNSSSSSLITCPWQGLKKYTGAHARPHGMKATGLLQSSFPIGVDAAAIVRQWADASNLHHRIQHALPICSLCGSLWSGTCSLSEALGLCASTVCRHDFATTSDRGGRARRCFHVAFMVVEDVCVVEVM